MVVGIVRNHKGIHQGLTWAKLLELAMRYTQYLGTSDINEPFDSGEPSF